MNPLERLKSAQLYLRNAAKLCRGVEDRSEGEAQQLASGALDEIEGATAVIAEYLREAEQ